jgi:hypothetical protein
MPLHPQVNVEADAIDFLLIVASFYLLVTHQKSVKMLFVIGGDNSASQVHSATWSLDDIANRELVNEMRADPFSARTSQDEIPRRTWA